MKISPSIFKRFIGKMVDEDGGFWENTTGGECRKKGNEDYENSTLSTLANLEKKGR